MATSIPAIAARGPMPLLRLAPEEAPGSVLGLDSKDAKAASKLTSALRKAFANRGISGGEEISLEEMRLTMGCTNDGVACLAEGGQTLGVRRLVFGYLAPAGDVYQLDIQIVDTEGGTLEAQATIALTKDDLTNKSIDATATRIVNELMPPKDADTDMPPRPDETLPDVEPEPEVEPEPKEPRESALWFGLEKPSPRWKVIGFSTSLALTLAAAGATIGMGVWLTAGDTASFGFRQKLLGAAEATRAKLLGETFDITNNMNDPHFGVVPTDLPKTVDLCDYNAYEYSVDVDNNFTQGDPIFVPGTADRGVRDGEVGRICTRGTNVRTAQIALGAATGVMGLSTLVFAGLLLIHKRKKPGEQSFQRNHRLTLGVAPRPGGGFSLGGGMRF